MEITYKDGDGDIGLNPADTFAPYNYGSPYYYKVTAVDGDGDGGNTTIVYVAVDVQQPVVKVAVTPKPER